MASTYPSEVLCHEGEACFQCPVPGTSPGMWFCTCSSDKGQQEARWGTSPGNVQPPSLDLCSQNKSISSFLLPLVWAPLSLDLYSPVQPALRGRVLLPPWGIKSQILHVKWGLDERDPWTDYTFTPPWVFKVHRTVLRERLRWAAESRAGQPPPERGRSPLRAAASPAPVLSFPKPRTRLDGEVLLVFTAARLCQKQKPPGVLGEVYKALEKLGSFSPWSEGAVFSSRAGDWATPGAPSPLSSRLRLWEGLRGLHQIRQPLCQRAGRSGVRTHLQPQPGPPAAGGEDPSPRETSCFSRSQAAGGHGPLPTLRRSACLGTNVTVPCIQKFQRPRLPEDSGCGLSLWPRCPVVL